MDSILVDQGAYIGKWVYLDSLDLLSDVKVSVKVMNHDAKHYWDLLVIDAVKFEYTDIVDREAPDLYVRDTLCQGEYIEATCSETGWIYLVPAGTEKDLAVIKQVCLDSVISISKAVVSVPVSGTLEGTYWLYARDIHGNLSDPAAFIVVDIDKVLSEKFNIYPNPVFDILTIRSNISGDYILEITSLNGSVIDRQHITDKTHRLDISSFQKGVYFISIRSKDFTTTRKIIKLQ